MLFDFGWYIWASFLLKPKRFANENIFEPSYFLEHTVQPRNIRSDAAGAKRFNYLNYFFSYRRWRWQAEWNLIFLVYWNSAFNGKFYLAYNSCFQLFDFWIYSLNCQPNFRLYCPSQLYGSKPLFFCLVSTRILKKSRKRIKLYLLSIPKK